MAKLRLFDVSQYIASGKQNMTLSRGVIEDHGEYRANEMPIGGVVYLLDNTIIDFYDEDTELVFCFDRQAVRKQKIHTDNFPTLNGYKGNRPRNERYEDMVIQRQFAEDVIKMLGFNAIAVDELEADDCIASIVKYYKNSFEKIYVHTRDSDLYYLACDNVEIVPVGGSGKHVTMLNWEHTVKKDYIVPYNTLTISKMINGEAGDNIPKISTEMAERITALLPQSEFSKCGNNSLLRKWLLENVRADKRTMAVFELIAPIEAPFDDVELHESEFDKDLFRLIAKDLGCYKYRYANPVTTDKWVQFVEEYLNIYNWR